MVSAVERIAILSQLVMQYLTTIGIVNAVKLAKDIAITLDEIDHYNVELDKLADSFFMLFPGHWKRRTQFLLIVTKHWPHIMRELGKGSVERISTKPVYHASNFECCTSGLRTQVEINRIKNKIHMLEAPNLLAEVDFVADIITSNPSRTVSIVVPSSGIHDLLLCALNARKIDFTSYINNDVRELSQEFLDEVDDRFSNVLPSEMCGLLRELASIADVAKYHKPVEIVGVGDIKFLRSDIILLTELNEDSWSRTDSGSYWLHSLLRHKANLPVSTNGSLMEDSFYSCFCSDSEIYMLRAQKSAGSSKIKSPILAKFEAICKRHNRPIDYIIASQEASTVASAMQLSAIHPFHIPPEIRVEDIGLLIRDSRAFYAKNILNLCPLPALDKERCKRLTALKSFLSACLYSREQVTEWLERIRAIDLLLYYRCRSIPEWIISHLSGADILSNIHGEVHIPKFNLTLLGNCDTIKMEGGNAILINFGIGSAPQSTKNIILGLETPVMPLCYMAEKGGFEGMHIPISEVQIWSIGRPTHRRNDNPIDVTAIHVSSDMIAAFETTLYNVLGKCCDHADSTGGGKPDRYRHFKRGG
ncbi:MAG: hypothetical protein LBD43_00790 [Holosporales bacterium]|jgi:hypothetical protein|nr:hypothetical protein [Holosporales bacterium]